MAESSGRSVLDHALACASIGWHVFPIRPRTKVPAVQWSDWATTDRTEITAEFAGRDLDYGIACGKSGLLVVDEDAPDALAKFAAECGELVPDTFTVRTGREHGRHYYFLAPVGLDLGNGEGALKGRGLNVRGKGGYVLGPGSTHSSGTVYEVENQAPVAPLPGWLIDALRSPSRNGTGSPYDPPPVEFGGLAAVPAVVRGPRADRPGERHNVLVRYACSLRARSIPPDEAELLIGSVWQRCEQPPACLTPLTVEDALGTLHDVYRRYPPGPSAEHGQAGETTTPVEFGLSMLADVPDTPLAWRVAGLLPVEGRALLIAQKKTGKTVLALNLARALLDGSLFLGEFSARPVERVAYANGEVSPAMFRSWCTDLGIPADRLVVANTRGLPSPLRDDRTAERFAKHLARFAPAVLILDTFGRYFKGRSQNDSTDVGEFCDRLDRVATLAGVGEVVLVAHAGWAEGGRARGSSVLEDWPDAIWRLTSGQPGKADAPRYLSAEGRDVLLNGRRLSFDADSRALALTDATREDEQGGRFVGEVVPVLRAAGEPLTLTELAARLKHRNSDALAAVRLAAERGLIEGDDSDPARFSVAETDSPFPSSQIPGIGVGTLEPGSSEPGNRAGTCGTWPPRQAGESPVNTEVPKITEPAGTSGTEPRGLPFDGFTP